MPISKCNRNLFNGEWLKYAPIITLCFFTSLLFMSAGLFLFETKVPRCWPGFFCAQNYQILLNTIYSDSFINLLRIETAYANIKWTFRNILKVKYFLMDGPKNTLCFLHPHFCVCGVVPLRNQSVPELARLLLVPTLPNYIWIPLTVILISIC